MKSKLNFIFVILISINYYCQNTFVIKEVPQGIKNKYAIFYALPVIKDKTPYYVEKSIGKLGKNYDYTQIIQNAVNNYQFVILPNFPIYINKSGLKIPSDRIIYFQKFSQILFKGPADSRDSDILKLYDVKNVQIYNPNIVGSKFSKEKQWGEWSAGIAILGCENIQIYNANISKTFGDGIIVANQSKNILLTNGWIDQARRDGISITSGIDVTISNFTISNTTGTLPMCGIQIEPDFPSDSLHNIIIKNIIGYNNNNSTLTFNLGSLNQNELIQNNIISISASNIIDYYSTRTLIFVMNADNKKITPAGFIKINNVKSYNSKNFLWKDLGKSNVKIYTNDIFDSDHNKIYIR